MKNHEPKIFGERSARQDKLYRLYIHYSLRSVGEIFCLFGEFRVLVCWNAMRALPTPIATDRPFP